MVGTADLYLMLYTCTIGTGGTGKIALIIYELRVTIYELRFTICQLPPEIRSRYILIEVD